MKMLRRLPKILRFIPGTAQDVRAYFLTLQYWLAGSSDNVVGMVQLPGRPLRRRPAPRPARRRQGGPAGRVPGGGRLSPAPGGPHRRARRGAAPGPASRGTVGLLLMRSYLLAGNTAHYDGVIAAHGGPRPARDPGLRHRPRLAAGDREVLLRRRPAGGRCAWSRSPASRWSAAPPTTTPGPPRRCWPGWTCPISPRRRSSSRRWTSGKTPTAACCRSSPP